MNVVLLRLLPESNSPDFDGKNSERMGSTGFPWRIRHYIPEDNAISFALFTGLCRGSGRAGLAIPVGPFIGHLGQRQSHHPVHGLGLGTGPGGNGIMLARTAVFEDTALTIQQGLPAPLWRPPGGRREAKTPTQVTDTGEGREGQGEMSVDTGRGPVEDRSHLEIMFLDAEAFLDRPPAVVRVEEFRQGHPADVGDDAWRPSQRAASAVRSESRVTRGFAFDAQEATLGMAGQ